MARTKVTRRVRKTKRTHWFFRWPTFVVLIVLVFFLARGVIDMTFKYQRAVASTEMAKQEHGELYERKEELENRIERLNTDTGFEAELRSKYNVSREGEEVVVLVGEEENIENSIKEEDKGWWSAITDVFSRNEEDNM